MKAETVKLSKELFGDDTIGGLFNLHMKLIDIYDCYVIIDPWKTMDHIVEYYVSLKIHVNYLPNHDMNDCDFLADIELPDRWFGNYKQAMRYGLNELMKIIIKNKNE